MIALAHQKGLLTTPYVFSAADAEAMTRAGADIIVCHLGLTTGGSIGADTALKLADCPAIVDNWAASALAINPDILVLVHGGPVAEPADAEYILRHTKHCQGFYGASSMEGLPTERALTEQTRKFKAVTFGAYKTTMAAQTFGIFILWLIIAAIVVAVLVYILRWLYRRSTKETAFVIPVLPEITPVNMNVLRVEVRREDGQALITKNRMRVDLVAEFFVRVGGPKLWSPPPPRFWAAAPCDRMACATCWRANSPALCTPSPRR